MDYSITLIFVSIILVFCQQLYYNYFKSGSKISDKRLMENYISLTMTKKHPGAYFPPTFKHFNINEKEF